MRKLIHFLLILCIASPLVHSKTAIYGTVVHKTLFFWFIAEILLILAILNPKKNEIQFKNTLISKCVLILGVTTLLSDLLGISPSMSFFSTFERMMGFITLFHFIVFYFVLTTFVDTKKMWFTLAIASTIAAIIISILGLKDMHLYDDHRNQSILANPSYLAIYLLFSLFTVVILAEYAFKKNKLTLFLSLPIFILLTIALFYTNTRSGVFGLIAGIIVALVYILFQSKKAILPVGIGLGLVIGVTAFVFLNKQKPWVQQQYILQKMTDVGFGSNTISARLKVWKMTLNGVFEKPILGWGEGNFSHFYAKYYTPDLYDVGYWYDSSHNLILDKIIQTGFVGLLAFLGLIIAVLIGILKAKTAFSAWERGFLIGSLIAYMVCLSFGFDCFVSYLGLFSILAYVNSNASFNATKLTFNLPTKALLSLKIILICGFLFSSYYLIFKAIQTNTALTKAYNQGDVNSLISESQKAMEISNLWYYDVAIRLGLKNETLANLSDTENETFSREAGNILEIALKKHIGDPVLMTQLGLVQNRAFPKQAIQTYQKLAEIAPNRQLNLIDYGVFLLGDDQNKEALAVFEKAYKLDSNYKTAKAYLALGLAANANPKEAVSVLKTLSSKTVADNLNLVINIFETGDNPAEFPDFMLEMPDKAGFSQNCYLEWAREAKKYGNNHALAIAFYAYERHFLSIQGMPNIARVINNVNLGKTSPDTMAVYFSQFPNR